MFDVKKGMPQDAGGIKYSFDLKLGMEKFGPHDQAWFWQTRDREGNPIHWRLEARRVFTSKEFGSVSQAEDEVDNYAEQFLGEKPNWIKQPFDMATMLRKQLGGLDLWSNSRNLALTSDQMKGVFKKYDDGIMKTYLLRGTKKPPEIEFDELMDRKKLVSGNGGVLG